MRLENEFYSPLDFDRTWEALTNLERVASCVPGATLDTVNDHEFAGSVAVRLGPMSVTYAGTGQFVELDQQAGRLAMQGAARERRGLGTVQALASVTLHPDGERTRCALTTDLEISGRPAQFGRGMIQDVSDKLIGQFATNLTDQLNGSRPSGNDAPTMLDLPQLIMETRLRWVALIGGGALVAGLAYFLQGRLNACTDRGH